MDGLVKKDLSSQTDCIRNAASSGLAYRRERMETEAWSKFWGCLDTLRDMDSAIAELLSLERNPTRAECIGFLQVLVSQQDSVHHLSKSVNIDGWKPDEHQSLSVIRDLRNRISSHSAWSDRSSDGVTSTSMINWSDIRVGGFKAIIYKKPEAEGVPVYEDISFAELISENVCGLSLQLGEILAQMERQEKEICGRLAALDWGCFDSSGDDYLFEKLWSPWENSRVEQAVRHLQIFKERLALAKRFFDENRIFEVSDFNHTALIHGASRLEMYLTNSQTTEAKRYEYHIMLIGWKRLWKEFDDEISELRQKLT